MAFQKKDWQARQGTGLNKFSINGAAPVTLVNVPDSVSIPGDAFSRENMNDLETRIEAGIQSASPYKIYGVRVDKNNSDPLTSVEYIDDAVGFTPAAGNNGAFYGGSWLDKYPFNAIKPCLLKGGSRVGYLNQNNYAQFANGSPADITSGAAGDVMVEYPFTCYSFSEDANYRYFRITNAPNMPGFTDGAFRYKGVVKNTFHRAAYKGWFDGASLRSLSGKTPTVSQTINTFRTQARANGNGYEQTAHHQITLLQVMYLIMFKNRHSQSALGAGYTGGSASQVTGATDTAGMYFGQTSTTSRVKLFGSEDFWGNVWEWDEGYMQNNYDLYVANGDYNDTGAGYTKVADLPATLSGYIKDIRGTNALGFAIADGTGSSSTYYSDYGAAGAAAAVLVAVFGGYWSSGSIAGAFSCVCSYAVSYSYSSIGSRLAFCGDVA
jgi:hypothetical protein